MHIVGSAQLLWHGLGSWQGVRIAFDPREDRLMMRAFRAIAAVDETAA